MLLTATMMLGGCTDDRLGADEAIDASFDVDGKADAASWSGGDIAGALRTAASLSESDLVSEVGLTTQAARSIVEARPIRSLAELDAVPFVGPISLDRLIAFAEAEGWTASDMVAIAAGTFQMGDSDEPNALYQPLHPVTLSRYWIDRTEVTNRDWRTCVAAGACPQRFRDEWLPIGYETDQAFSDHPVVNITHDQAQGYCEWIGKTLPTEAQWEKAARGTTDTRPFPWGTELPTCERANYSLRCTYQEGVGWIDSIAAVGTWPNDVSPAGVLDMAGNVAEHVYDGGRDDVLASCSGGACVDPVTEPTEPDVETRMTRGASYLTVRDIHGARIHDRQQRSTGHYSRKLGFRCAVR